MKKKKTQTQRGLHPRKLARSIAKANMKKAGIQHINSMFAYNWRDYVFVR